MKIALFFLTLLYPLYAVADEFQSASVVTTLPPIARLFSGLLICLGVFCCGIYLAKRRGLIKHTGERRVSILERIPLTARTSLVLLEKDGKEILLSVGSEQVSYLLNSENDQNQVVEHDEKGIHHIKEFAGNL